MNRGWWLVIGRRAGRFWPALFIAVFAAAVTAAAQSPREHTRLNPRGTRVTESQAETLTLTLGTAEVRLLQTWVRTAGTIDKYQLTPRQILIYLPGIDPTTTVPLPYTLRPTMPVNIQSPAATAYEYYNPQRRVQSDSTHLEIRGL